MWKEWLYPFWMQTQTLVPMSPTLFSRSEVQSHNLVEPKLFCHRPSHSNLPQQPFQIWVPPKVTDSSLRYTLLVLILQPRIRLIITSNFYAQYRPAILLSILFHKYSHGKAQKQIRTTFVVGYALAKRRTKHKLLKNWSITLSIISRFKRTSCLMPNFQVKTHIMQHKALPSWSTLINPSTCTKIWGTKVPFLSIAVHFLPPVWQPVLPIQLDMPKYKCKSKP